MKTFELIPTNGRKSFGHKARVIEQDNKATLLSYDSQICEFNLSNREFKMLYTDKLSNTTSSHLKAFKELYKLN
jgi:hypothetical protein